MAESQQDQLSVYTWVKDANFRFVSCSENLCELAGEDSPHGMIGKDDFSLIWRDGASLFREADIRVIKGEIKHFNVLETIKIVAEGQIHLQQILITKIPIFNRFGECIGIAGSHVNLPSKNDAGTMCRFDHKGRLWLYGTLNHEYLTKREAQVLRLILLGKTSKLIARTIGISYRTVECYTERIKMKLQCVHKYEIHSVAIAQGITHLLTAININNSLCDS